MIRRARRLDRAVLDFPRVVDVALFIFLALSMTVELAALRAAFFTVSTPFHRGLWFVFSALIVLAILFRRLAPVTVLVAVTSIQFVFILLLSWDWLPVTPLWCSWVAVYTVSSERTIRWTIAGLTVGTLAWIPAVPVQALPEAFLVVSLTLAAVAGFSMQSGRRLNTELRQQGDLLQSTREERLNLAVTQERARVARDLHDVVAHAVTLMVIQSGAARTVARADREQADQTLARVEAMADEALRELDSLTELIGSDGHVRMESAPPIGLETIPSLIERERGTGLDVGLRLEGASRQLEPAMEISVYRIVQEGLTNARRHAPGATVSVTLRYLPDAMEIEVANGRVQAETGPGPVSGFGRGLIGVRERAALFGGVAAAAPTPDGGYRVQARLPVELEPA